MGYARDVRHIGGTWAPALGRAGGDYELSVKVERKASAPYVPLQ
jgi:hypothetical protein